jgi:molybdopterin-guanine dinucleotide biosynthesis protein A
VADRGLTGVLLVGGASRRFGSPKALAKLGDETLAERAWRTLAFCDERIAVGKAVQNLQLPFPMLDDGVDVQAPSAGVVGGLRAAKHELVVFLPVDMPLVTEDVLRLLAAACRDAAVPQTGPLPGAYRRSTLPVFERSVREGRLSFSDVLPWLDVADVKVDEALLANANTPQELAALSTIV